MKNKNILILSADSDSSTDKVIDWIRFLKEDASVIRKNSPNLDSTLQIKKKSVFSVWYRKLFDLQYDRRNQLDEFIYNELLNTYKASLLNLSSNIKLGSIKNSTPNKLHVLYKAKEEGLNIPESLVTSNKSELILFKQKHNEIIIKCISDTITIDDDGKKKAFYTHSITEAEITKLPKKFIISLFQKRIIKKYEIRTFFLKNQFYSMAIFSANNKLTEVDMRNYDFDKPNRIIPYKLPIEIEKKLFKLMKKEDLNTGSIDLIKGVDGKYYFLEVNPIGQFGELSFMCNYRIEKKIAQFLTNQ